MNFRGVIIEESLKDKSVLDDVEILKTKIEEVTPEQNTPHLKQWTLHTFEIPEDKGEKIASKMSKALDTSHNSWYADFRNKNFHYIIL